MKMNELITTEGDTGSKDNVIIIMDTLINGVSRDKFPQELWITKEIIEEMKNMFRKILNPKTTRSLWLKQKKERENYNCFQRNFINCSSDIYDYGIYYYNFIISFEQQLNKIFKILPKTLYSIYLYEPYFIPSNIDKLEYEILALRPQAISFLEQKYPVEFRKEIELFKELNKSTGTNQDFDEYIDKWAKRLLTGGLK